MRIIDGAQHPLGHGAPVGAELRVDARHHDVQPVQHLRGLVQGAVLQDVHLDPGQKAEVAAVRVDVRNNVQLFPKAFGAQAVGDLEVGGVVRQGEVIPAQCPGGVSHQSDRGSAVGPVAVAVQVPAEGRAQFGPAARQGLLPALAQILKIVGHAAVDRLPDDVERSVADPLHALEPAVACPRCDLLRVQGADNPGRLAERLDLEGGGEPAFEPERNLIEGINGIHQSILHPLCPAPPPSWPGFCIGGRGRFWIIRGSALIVL